VGAGASWTGAAEVCFGAAGFLVVPAAEADVAGRGDGNGALAGGPDDGGARAADGPAAALGSGDMMLIAGVEAAEGKSAVVGLPDGIDDESIANGAAAFGGGAPHVGA
jgi:hypothetical protein